MSLHRVDTRVIILCAVLAAPVILAVLANESWALLDPRSFTVAYYFELAESAPGGGELPPTLDPWGRAWIRRGGCVYSAGESDVFEVPVAYDPSVAGRLVLLAGQRRNLAAVVVWCVGVTCLAGLKSVRPLWVAVACHGLVAIVVGAATPVFLSRALLRLLEANRVVASTTGAVFLVGVFLLTMSVRSPELALSEESVGAE